MNTNRGIAPFLLIIAVVGSLVIAGGAYYLNERPQPAPLPPPPPVALPTIPPPPPVKSTIEPPLAKPIVSDGMKPDARTATSTQSATTTPDTTGTTTVPVLLDAPPLTPAKTTSLAGIQLDSQTWSGIVRITDNVYFSPLATLTIEPGTKILFEKKPDIPDTDWVERADEFIKSHNDPTGRKGYRLTHWTLRAKIIARGTSEVPIIFTSAADKPEYADWEGLALLGGSALENVEVSYGRTGITIEENNVTVQKSKIHDSLWSCIDIYSSGNTIADNEIYHCWHQAIGVKKSGANAIRANTVRDARIAVKCENGANPEITQNTFKAAPLGDTCKNLKDNAIEPGSADVMGGTYSGVLIYPAR